jgi:hypothetical protein
MHPSKRQQDLPARGDNRFGPCRAVHRRSNLGSMSGWRPKTATALQALAIDPNRNHETTISCILRLRQHIYLFSSFWGWYPLPAFGASDSHRHKADVGMKTAWTMAMLQIFGTRGEKSSSGQKANMGTVKNIMMSREMPIENDIQLMRYRQFRFQFT